MKNSSRIGLFVISIVLLFGCTAGVFLLVIAPTNRLEAEYDTLSSLDTALADLQIACLRNASLADALASADAAFDRASIAPYARSRSAALSGFSDSLAEWRQSVDEGVASVTAETAGSLVDSIAGVRSRVTGALPAVASSIRRSQLLSFIVSGVIIVAVWLLGLLAVRLLSRSVNRITGTVSSMLDCLARGDIDSCMALVASGSGDEAVSRMSVFVRRLADMIGVLRREAGKNVESGTNLSQSLDNTSSTFEVVDGFIESIRGEVQTLEQQISLVKTGLERITHGLGNLDSGITNQKKVVEGSLVSVNGMIDSIGDMSGEANQNGKLAEQLLHSSEHGQSLFGSTYQQITAISDSISRINGMATVIDNISEQTGMLALNAAIEAAHAGESGKGFAVVAEEIEKLSEASSESSREIAVSIEEIVDHITSMASSGGELDRAFEQMTGDIGKVYESFSGFRSGLSDSNRNSEAVLGTMNTLREVTDNVTRDSGLMADGAGEIAKSMAELEMISSRVFDGVTAMSLMLDGLKDVMKDFKTIAESMKQSGIAMSGELKQL